MTLAERMAAHGAKKPDPRKRPGKFNRWNSQRIALKEQLAKAKGHYKKRNPASVTEKKKPVAVSIRGTEIRGGNYGK